MPVQPGTRKIGSSSFIGELKFARGDYDFVVDGGAVSTITLRGDTVPSGAIVTDSFIKVVTALTGGTVTDTLSAGVESTTDLQSAAARNAAPWSTTGTKRITLTATTAPAVTTAARSLRFVINGTALTAGKFSLVVAYVELV